MQKLQLIPLDETAAKAVEHIQPNENILKTPFVLSDIAMVCKEGYQHILITTNFNEEVLYALLDIVKKGLTPILFFNDDAFELNESEVMKYLLVSNTVLFPVTNEGIASITYAEYLEIFIEIYTLEDHEENVKVDEKDIATVLHGNALCYLYTAKNSSLYKITTQLYNKYQSMLKQSSSLLVNFFSPKDTPLVMIMESIETLEPLIPETTNWMFQISTREEKKLYKISMINTMDVSIQEIIQDEIDQQKTYLKKLSVIVESYEKGFLSAEEANALGEKNGIAPDDMDEFYQLFYQQKEQLVELLQELRKKDVSQNTKEELLVKAIGDGADIAIANELIESYKLDRDRVVELMEE